jgi:hypothetical protein
MNSRCWRVFLQICKLLLTRFLFSYRLTLYSHGFWGLENHFLPDEGGLLSSFSFRPPDEFSLLNGGRGDCHASIANRGLVQEAWLAGFHPQQRPRCRYNSTDCRSGPVSERDLVVEIGPDDRRLLVVPFAKHQLRAVEGWIRWNLPLACSPNETVPSSTRTVLALYISTTWDTSTCEHLVEILSRVGGYAWHTCLEPVVYFIEAALDTNEDRYARSSWVSERDSAGTGNMFYPLIFTASAAHSDAYAGTSHLEPWLGHGQRSLRAHRVPMVGARSTNASDWFAANVKLPRIRYLFWCEPDCHAVRARFDVAFHQMTRLADERRLWVLGSPLRSSNEDARVSWRLQYHEDAHRTQMNGNALYRIGDFEFCRWLWRVWLHHGTAAFDVAMDRQLHSTLDGFWERANIMERFAQTDWVHNLGHESYAWQTYRRQHPHCFFVHGSPLHSNEGKNCKTTA